MGQDRGVLYAIHNNDIHVGLFADSWLAGAVFDKHALDLPEDWRGRLELVEYELIDREYQRIGVVRSKFVP